MKMQDNCEIKPIIAKDIHSWILFEKKDGNIYCMGSLEKDKYIQLHETILEPVKTAVAYFDGTRSLEEIEEILIREHSMKLDVVKLYDLLCKANLIEGIDKALIEKQEMDYLSITLKEFKLNKIYNFLDKLNKLLFPYIIYITAAIIGVSIVFFAKNLHNFVRASNYALSGSYALGISVSLIIFIVSIGLHELAHGIAGYRFGLRPSKLVIALYVFTPMFYLKMPGIYTIKPKKRIYVWAAGVYTNLIIAASAIILSEFASGNIRNILFLCSITNLSLILANLSPLLPLDGYFIVSTLLKRPNLRKGSYKEFKKWALGKENKFRGLSIIYFLLSSLFVAAIAGYELYWAAGVIVQGINNNYTFLQVIYQFRYILALILIIAVKKLLETVLKYRGRKQLLGVSNQA